MKEVQVVNNEVAATPNQDPMLSMIDRVCSDPNFDIIKMEKLIEMYNAKLNRAAEIDFSKAFAEMQPHLPKVISTHYNNQTKSKYAKIDDINAAVLPILSEYGFGITFKIVSQDDKGVTVRATLMHSAGHKEFTDLLMPYDKCGTKGTVNKTDIHATGSTISYAKRYAMCMLLDISTGTDNDGNKEPVDVLATAAQREAIGMLCSKLVLEHQEKFTKDFGCLTEIKKSDVDSAMALLNNTLKDYGV